MPSGHRRRFTVADQEKATAGIECRKDAYVIDRYALAYKVINAVMAAHSKPVTSFNTLPQVVCVKG